MTKEILREARYYCDGCGYAVLESTSEHIEQAFEQCGWVHATTHHGDKVDYCPVCRRDSPFEAVQRVRELHCRYDAMDGYVNVRCNCCGHPWPCPTISALDGGSEYVVRQLWDALRSMR